VVTTHLFHFFDGATASDASAAGTQYGTSQAPIGFWAHNDGASTGTGTTAGPRSLFAYWLGGAGLAVSTGQVGAGGRGGVNPWPGRAGRSWDKWWKKEHQKRLQKKKEAVEKKVQELETQLRDIRDDLQEARTLEAIKRLIKRLERLEALLQAEQARLDDLEMQEVAMIWAAWSDD
jgi:hypothetical protein